MIFRKRKVRTECSASIAQVRCSTEQASRCRVVDVSALCSFVMCVCVCVLTGFCVCSVVLCGVCMVDVCGRCVGC